MIKKKSPDLRVVIIAEVGECFNGDLDAAGLLIQAAKEADCDIVKFQTLDYDNIAEDDPERDWFRRIALNPAGILFLVDLARRHGIDILFTPENVRTAQWILDAGLRSIKIASSLVNDLELLRFIRDHFQRVFVSTGMASLDEVAAAVDLLSGIDDLYIMHCVSEYPTGPLLEKRGLRALAHEDVNLNMMKMLMYLYPMYKVGYSDHTAGVLAPTAAVAAGARVIEKHITLDRSTPVRNYETGGMYLGTDHVLSLEPEELKQMVSQIREIEKMFGPWKWERTEGEKILIEFLRGRFRVET